MEKKNNMKTLGTEKWANIETLSINKKNIIIIIIIIIINIIIIIILPHFPNGRSIWLIITGPWFDSR